MLLEFGIDKYTSINIYTPGWDFNTRHCDTCKNRLRKLRTPKTNAVECH